MPRLHPGDVDVDGLCHRCQTNLSFFACFLTFEMLKEPSRQLVPKTGMIFISIQPACWIFEQSKQSVWVTSMKRTHQLMERRPTPRQQSESQGSVFQVPCCQGKGCGVGAKAIADSLKRLLKIGAFGHRQHPVCSRQTLWPLHTLVSIKFCTSQMKEFVLQRANDWHHLHQKDEPWQCIRLCPQPCFLTKCSFLLDTHVYGLASLMQCLSKTLIQVFFNWLCSLFQGCFWVLRCNSWQLTNGNNSIIDKEITSGQPHLTTIVQDMCTIYFYSTSTGTIFNVHIS